MSPLKTCVILTNLFATLLGAQQTAFRQIVGIDSLGRSVASVSEVGPRRTPRDVGVFYFLVAGSGSERTSGPFDIQKIFQAGGLDAKLNPWNPAWGNTAWNRVYWDEPLFGYYRSDDPWVVRKHLQLLTLAGIGFIALDYTNNEIGDPGINNAAIVVLDCIADLRRQGWDAPQVVFYTHIDPTEAQSGIARRIYNTFYAPDLQRTPRRYDDVWLKMESGTGLRPLIIGSSAEIQSDGVLAQYFTQRESDWPTTTSSPSTPKNSWPWISWLRPPLVHSDQNGNGEVVNVSIAQHAEGDHVMSSYPFTGVEKNWGRGYSYGSSDHGNGAILRGDNFEEQWINALSQDVPYVFVTGWNEGGAYRILKDKGLQDWSANGAIADFDYQGGGAIGGNIVAASPFITGGGAWGFPISSSFRNAIQVEIDVTPGVNTTQTRNATLYFSTINAAGGIVNDFGAIPQGQSVPVSPSSGFQQIQFDMTAVQQWSGQLGHLMLVIPNWGNAGSFRIRRISLVTLNGGISKVEDQLVEEDNSLGWSAAWNVSDFGRHPKGVVGGTNQANDPAILSEDQLGIVVPKDRLLTVGIRMRNMSSNTGAQLFYITNDDQNWDENKSVSFSITSNDAVFKDYVVGLDKIPENASLKQLRFDPGDSGQGSFRIDHIRVFLDQNQFPVKSWEFGPTHEMIDQCDVEFSRDAEMSKGILGDNYYMQLADFTRRMVGSEDLKVGSAAKTILFSYADFSQWDDVGPIFRDFTGDVLHRNHAGVGSTTLSNATGRNDIVEAKVARNSTHLYFYVKTEANLTSEKGPNWMQLYLDLDGNQKNGWHGADYVVNRLPPSSATGTAAPDPVSTFAVLERNVGGWRWEKVSDVRLLRDGNQMQIGIPRSQIGNVSDSLGVRFKWIDNVDGSNVMSYYLDGDAAPDGRFYYEYLPENKELPVNKGVKVEVASRWASNSYFPASNASGNGLFWSTTTLEETEPEEFVVDISKLENLESISILPRAKGRGVVGFPRSFQFQYRNSLGNWDPIPGMSFENYPLPVAGKEVVFKFSSPIRTDGIKWVGTKHRFDDDGRYFFMQAADVRVYKSSALSWEFNNNSEGWKSTGTTQALTGPVQGRVDGIVSGVDPQVVSPSGLGLGISKETNNVIRVRYQNRTSSKVGQIYFSTNDVGFGDSQKKEFAITPNDQGYTEYVIDMSGTQGWKGVLNQLRLDPESGVGTGSFSIDYIRLTDSRQPAISWEYASHQNDMGGWVSGNSSTTLRWLPEGAISGSVLGVDPAIFSPDGLGINISGSKIVRVRLWNKTSDDEAQIYFRTESSSGWSEVKSKVFKIVPNDKGYREYVVDMAGVKDAKNIPQWNGILKQIRLDPVRTALSGEFLVDYIRVQAW